MTGPTQTGWVGKDCNRAICRLEQEAGLAGLCSGDRCPFWANASDGTTGCVLEQLDLHGRKRLAAGLLELRRSIDHDEVEARQLFFARLNAGRSD
jgi:hypothetical protein